MRAHVIKDGVVVNTIEAESISLLDGLVDASNGGEIGDLYKDGRFTTPELEEKTPPIDLNKALTEAQKEALIALVSN